MLEIADEDVHRLHFHVRDGATGGIRAMDKYLERLDDIRRIQTYVVGRALDARASRWSRMRTWTGRSTSVMELVMRRGRAFRESQ